METENQRGLRSASTRWREGLAAWAIPPAILNGAPESPWGLPVEPFRRSAEQSLSGSVPPTPPRRRAAEALSDGGSVLDVGAGAGAAGLALMPPGTHLVAVDQSAEMLAAFALLADRAGISHSEVEGEWPTVTEAVEVADVVVCHDVFYNVADLAPFCVALTDHARRRVVVQLTSTHPMSWLNPLWRRFHGIERPEGPTVDDAVAVLAEIGLAVEEERWRGSGRFAGMPRSQHVAFVRKRLCLPASADPEIDEAMGEPPSWREAVCLWWPGGA